MRTEEMRRVADTLDDIAIAARPLAGGFSHETFLLTLRDSAVVVRTGATHYDIETAVMARVRQYVPVPRVRAVLPETATTRSMMVLDYAPGTLLSEVLRPDSPDLPELGEEVGRVIARIGTVRFDRPGFFADDELTIPPQPPWSRQLPPFVAGRMAEPGAVARLEESTRQRWTALCARHAPALTEVDDVARLVHSDANPKNILVQRRAGRWQVTAVLDWEFSFSGCPCGDAANMLRFRAEYPSEFTAGFQTGFGARQSRDCLHTGWVMDMFALSELVTRPPGHHIAARAADRIRQIVAAAGHDDVTNSAVRAKKADDSGS